MIIIYEVRLKNSDCKRPNKKKKTAKKWRRSNRRDIIVFACNKVKLMSHIKVDRIKLNFKQWVQIQIASKFLKSFQPLLIRHLDKIAKSLYVVKLMHREEKEKQTESHQVFIRTYWKKWKENKVVKVEQSLLTVWRSYKLYIGTYIIKTQTSKPKIHKLQDVGSEVWFL